MRLLSTSALLALLLVLAQWPRTAEAMDVRGVLATSGTTSIRAVLRAEGRGLDRSISIIQLDARGKRLHDYDLDMQRRMHLIVVSGDFSTFMHVHPTLGSDGVFRIDIRFPAAGVYHIYADTEPRGFGHNVFRFELPVETDAKAPVPSLGPPTDAASAGPYAVRLSADRFTANVPTPITIVITEHAKPASGLHPYLGAYAHIVAIDARDLSYTHVHAMAPRAPVMTMSGDMDTGSDLPASAIVPPTMRATIDLPRPGSYKVWVQFMGGDALYVAPFVVTAR